MLARWIFAITLTGLCALASAADIVVEGLGSLSRERLLSVLVTGDPTDANAERLDVHLPEALSIFESAHKAEPKDGRWAAGIALVLLRQGDEDEAYTWAKKAVKLSPKNADAHYAKGTVAGRKTESAGMFSKIGLANACKDSFHKAVKLDPQHYASRVGLVMYYTFAPGIAGGSWSKAYKQAEAITEIPGRAGDGYALAALVASQKGDWEKYDASIESALGAAETEAERDDIRCDAAFIALQRREDASGAVALLETIGDAGVIASTTYAYVMARALDALERYAEAVPWYAALTERSPDAEYAPFLHGRAALKAGAYEAAIGAFESYLARFPKGEYASQAKKGIENAKDALGSD